MTKLCAIYHNCHQEEGEYFCKLINDRHSLFNIISASWQNEKNCHLSNKINLTQWWKIGAKYKKNCFCCYLVFLKQYSLLQKHLKITEGKVTRYTYLRRRWHCPEQLDCSLISPSRCLVCWRHFYMTQTFFFL